MNKKSDLQKIPGVGKSISQDLQNIGIRRIDDLVGKNPEALYDLSNQHAGYNQDRCLLYVFREAVYFAGGGRLINGFVENYKREYVDKGDLKPIYVEAREKTSYPIIMSSVDKSAERLGVRIRVDEVDSRQVGDDIMHELWLRPVAA